MATFSYNPFLKASHSNQYLTYIQNQSFINQIDEVVRDTGKMNADVIAIQSREVQNAINTTSQAQREAIIASSNAICASFESGFAEVNYNLSGIQDDIYRMCNLIGHGFDLLLEQHKITNIYLGRIENLLRIPDSQKQRVYHINEGMKYLQNAFNQSANSDFYTDALEEFQASQVIEKKDFFALYHIGFIYLKSTKHFDPKSSENYFRNAARYYLAEAIVGGTNVSTNLLKSNRGFILEATEAYLFAAEACYLQERFSDAAGLAEEAWKTLPEIVKAGFMQAKYLAANNQVGKAVNILEEIIRKDRFISLDVLSDIDLISKTEVRNLLEKLRLEAYNESSQLLAECKKHIIEESVIQREIDEIEELVLKKSFLHCKRAVDLLSDAIERTFSDIFKTNNKGLFKSNRNLNELPSILKEVVEKVKLPNYHTHYPTTTIKHLFSYLTEKTQWVFPQISSSEEILNFTNVYFPKKMTSNILAFIKKEREYYLDLPSAKSKIIKEVEEIYKNDSIKYSEWQVELQKYKNKKSLEYVWANIMSWGSLFALLGGIGRGFTGCISCAEVTNQNGTFWDDYNLFSGAFQGAIGGFIIGAFIGAIVGWIKGQE